MAKIILKLWMYFCVLFTVGMACNFAANMVSKTNSTIMVGMAAMFVIGTIGTGVILLSKIRKIEW